MKHTLLTQSADCHCEPSRETRGVAIRVQFKRRLLRFARNDWPKIALCVLLSLVSAVPAYAGTAKSFSDDALDSQAYWPTDSHDARNSYLTPFNGPDYPTPVFSKTLEVIPNNGNKRGALIGRDGTIYYNTNRTFYAIHPDGTVKYQLAQGNGYESGAMLTNNGHIISVHSTGAVVARNISDGTIIWTYQSKFTSDFGGLNSGPDGSIYLCDRNFGMEAINPNGTRRFFIDRNTISCRDSTVAVDWNNGIIYGSDDQSNTAVNPNGTIIWAKGTTNSVGNPPTLSPDGQTIFILGRGLLSNSVAMNALTGDVLWKTGDLGAGYTDMPLSPDGNTVYTTLDNTLTARDVKTGAVLWTKSYIRESFTTKLILDGKGRIYDNDRAWNPDGSVRWTIGPNVHTGAYPVIGKDGFLLYVKAGTTSIFAYTPWTLSLTTNKPSYKPGEMATLTATSSMLSVTPITTGISNNLVQAIMPDGTKVPLHYARKDGPNTIWTGTYQIPHTPTGVVKGKVEATQYNVTTDIVTSFGNLPATFNNTGINNTFSLTIEDAKAAAGGGDDPYTLANMWKTTVSYSTKTYQQIRSYLKGAYTITADFVLK